jgi:hypothetical protein
MTKTYLKERTQACLPAGRDLRIQVNAKPIKNISFTGIIDPWTPWTLFF